MSETWPCRNCGQPVFYSAPDAVFLHGPHPRWGAYGNGYYCHGEPIGGKSADPDKPREPYVPRAPRDPEDIRAAVLGLPKRAPRIFATIAGFDHYDVLVASRVAQAGSEEELRAKVVDDLMGLIADHEAMVDEDYRAGTLPRHVARWDITIDGRRSVVRMERA